MEAVLPKLPPRFDPLDPDLLHDPYPVYSRMRSSALCRGGPATWVVTRYADVVSLLHDPRVGHAFPEELGRPAQILGGRPNFELSTIVSALEPPDHTRIRKLMTHALTPRIVHRMQQRIGERMDVLLDRGLDEGRLDAVTDLALPLQIAITSELVGVPESDRAEVSRRGMDLGRALILFPFVAEDRGNGESDARWLRDYVADLLAQRKRRPQEDLVSYLLAVAAGEPGLSDDEVIDNIVFLFFAGFETSMHLLASGVAALLRFPDQLARLRADRSLMSSAVDEIARFDAPIQWIVRVTGAPVEVGDRTIRAGRVLLLLLASANRDERHFAEPDRLDVGRRPNGHVSFGGGIHRCMGVLLARAQGSIAFGRLLDRCADLAPDGPVLVRPHPNLRGYAAVPLAVRPA